MQVWTDGSRLGDGRGGWAWVTDRDYDSGGETGTTNQRMEMVAVLEAVRTLGGPDLMIVSDSAYVVNAFQQQWYWGWIGNGWINSKKEPVANRDLWEALFEEVFTLGNVRFRKVKGHAGDPMNERADELCTEAARAVIL